MPSQYKNLIKNYLKKYEIFDFNFNASEKSKTIKSVNFFLNELLSKNFNRSDLVIGVGGGITGDMTGFVASIYKRVAPIVAPVTAIIVPHHLPKIKPEKINNGITKPKSNIQIIEKTKKISKCRLYQRTC